MKKKFFYIILIINAIALLGVILTQFYWVKEAYNLQEKQIENSVRLVMKGVSSQMLNFQSVKLRNIRHQDSLQIDPPKPRVQDIDPSLLSFKLKEEISSLQLNLSYEYGIVDHLDERIILGQHEKYTKELFTKAIEIPMVGFEDPGRYTLAVYFPRQMGAILHRMLDWLFLSILFSVVLIISFSLTIYFFQKQKKLNEMKSDFINNMTHEFKTPISVISLASELLLKPNINEDPLKALKYARIIYDENARMKSQVEQILKVSKLEKGEIELNKEKTDVNKLILRIVANFELAIRDREGIIQTDLKASKSEIHADYFHLTNIISNLLDNANKYSPNSPNILISTKNIEKGILISVEDHGIGISPQNQKNIFMNLFRVPTGNVHDVRGFGIGLYYVKTYVEAHDGRINLESELAKGSRFNVYLPFGNKPVLENEEEPS